MATFEEIEYAFFFVSSEACGMNRALLCRDNGEIYYHSEIDDLNELDEENFDCDNFLEIPHKNDLGLGICLALEFAQLRMPEETAQVDRIFQSPGAYGRFKELLSCKGLLQSWYNFENQREHEALREWCRENGIHAEMGSDRMLMLLDGWDGPEHITDGLFRYSKCISWIRLYIQVEGSEFYGGVSGTDDDFELVKAEGCWMRYSCHPAWTSAGEPKLILRGYSTWEAVYERMPEGARVQEKLASIEDLAAFLERSIG